MKEEYKMIRFLKGYISRIFKCFKDDIRNNMECRGKFVGYPRYNLFLYEVIELCGINNIDVEFCFGSLHLLDIRKVDVVQIRDVD